MQVTSLLNSTVRTMTELEGAMNSVERLRFYSTQIAQEAAATSVGVLPKGEWPSAGAISIKQLKMRYRSDTPLVLKGLNLDIKAGERIGVVGRTGSGKSSLMLCLMRLVEAEREGGEGVPGPISVDGVDISRIGLRELRSSIAIVPQNPVIFSGTMRSNLDPFGMHPDHAIWDALDKCGLKETVEAQGLDMAVAEFGENFSQGQRQLLCLARALLEKSKILLLDEATSSVDFQTDRLIQDTIRSSFTNCTILTIAHRLATVVDNDRIVVLEQGEVAEADAPRVLLANSMSMLSKMVDEMGEAAARAIRESVNTAIA
jgi:ABC-type multidrug transport system fused ATPase/permease subunit